MKDPQDRQPVTRAKASASIAEARRLANDNRVDEASELIEAAIRLEPRNPMLHYQLGILRRDLGDIARARRCFEKTLKLAPDAAGVYYNYARTKTFRHSDPVIARMRRCLRRLKSAAADGGDPREEIALQFALGKVYEDCGQYDRAFGYWQRANTLQRKQLTYRISDSLQRMAVIKRTFTAEFMAGRTLDKFDGCRPIFLVGMPRSGSTLSEQILASHDRVQGLGELTVLPSLVDDLGSWNVLDKSRLLEIREQYLKSVRADNSTDFFTDKLPGNFWRIGVIKLLFPDARIIDVRRHPIDTCLSCYKHWFSENQPFTYDLEDLKGYYGLYEQLMAFWQALFPGEIHTLHYEHLVTHPKATVEATLDYCGLDWQDQCLAFQENKRAVRTSSASQVRQALHSRAINHWRRFEAQLETLKTLEPATPTAD